MGTLLILAFFVRVHHHESEPLAGVLPGRPLQGRGMTAHDLHLVAGRISGGEDNADSALLEDEGLSPAELLDQAQVAEGLQEEYPTYELKAAGTAANAAMEAEEIADEVDMLEEQAELSGANDVSQDDEDTFLADEQQYRKAPVIKVPQAKLMKQGLWWGLKAYEKYYRAHPVNWYVPRIKKGHQLTVEEFHHTFRAHGRPVIFTFDNLRDLGFGMESYTIEELRARFPFDMEMLKDPRVFSQYEANKKVKDPAAQQMDLGPGLASISLDGEMLKIKSTKTGKKSARSFPRNMQVRPKDVEALGVVPPPLLHDMTLFQQATMWMGTSTSDTRFHHDCCDNFVEMVSGTKRFTLAPPTDWRTLNPNCVGKNKGLCWASVARPNDPKPTPRVAKIMGQVHKIVVDVGPGEILYMPAGWFHHIENLGPTVMVNFWTKKSEQIGLLAALKSSAGIAPGNLRAAA